MPSRSNSGKGKPTHGKSDMRPAIIPGNEQVVGVVVSCSGGDPPGFIVDVKGLSRMFAVLRKRGTGKITVGSWLLLNRFPADISSRTNAGLERCEIESRYTDNQVKELISKGHIKQDPKTDGIEYLGDVVNVKDERQARLREFQHQTTAAGASVAKSTTSKSHVAAVPVVRLSRAEREEQARLNREIPIYYSDEEDEEEEGEFIAAAAPTNGSSLAAVVEDSDEEDGISFGVSAKPAMAESATADGQEFGSGSESEEKHQEYGTAARRKKISKDKLTAYSRDKKHHRNGRKRSD